MDYKIVTSLLALVAGVLLIVFREKFVDAQKRRAATSNDIVSSEIVRRPRESSALLAIVVGIGFIIGAFINLASLL